MNAADRLADALRAIAAQTDVHLPGNPKGEAFINGMLADARAALADYDAERQAAPSLAESVRFAREVLGRQHDADAGHACRMPDRVLAILEPRA